MSEMKDRYIFEQLNLEFNKGDEILKVGQFFESQDDDNELFLIHSVRNFEYKPDTDTILVNYICEKVNSPEREKYDTNERKSLLSVDDSILIVFDFSWTDIKNQQLNSEVLLNTIVYQQDEETNKMLSLYLKGLEHLEFFEEEGETRLQAVFYVEVLLPIPETEAKQIKTILRKSKFNIISQ